MPADIRSDITDWDYITPTSHMTSMLYGHIRLAPIIVWLRQRGRDLMGDDGRAHNESTQGRPPDGRARRRFKPKEVYNVPESLIAEIFVFIINLNTMANH